jgi:hypothetical protein
MKTKADVLRIAAGEIGTKESPAGSNNVKYNTWFYGHEVRGPAYPWCMAFVVWTFWQAGFNLYKTASCSTLVSRYKTVKGKWVTSDFKPGDIAMFDFSGRKSRTQHTGIIEKVNGNWVTTIEGNTSLTSQDNGGAVMRRVRNIKYITGACRPGYNM